jgi:membrane protein implicated in regulation of membrane protease activity
MWLFWIVVFAALLSLLSFFAFPGATPIFAIVVLLLCVINAPLILRSARNRVRKDDGDVTRNRRGEVTDLGHFDDDRTLPRTQRAVFFGTPDWDRYRRAKDLPAH